MDAIYPSGQPDPLAVPSATDVGGATAPVLFTLEVDGEDFAIRSDGQGGTHYTWLSGPNDGYGFSESPTTHRPLQEHEASIRAFLAQVDPLTGHIADD